MHTAHRRPTARSSRHAAWAAGVALACAAVLGGCTTAPPPTKPAAHAAPASAADSLGIAFVRVPAGEFLMGSDESPATLAKAFPHADAKRLVDFAAGLAFALRGSFDKVATKVFLLSPADIDVSPEDRRKIAETGFYNHS